MTAHPLTCDQARLALSARLDGEPLGVPADLLSAHVDACAGCADWLARVEQVTRLVRVQPVERVPDLTDSIMAAVAADRVAVPAPRRRPLPRLALQRLIQAAVAAFAAMELSLALPVMFGFSEDHHATHEVGAFAAAVAVAFLIAAFQPRLARAYTPIAIVLAVCLSATSGLDIGEHRVTILHEIGGHFGTIAQAALIWALGRLYGSGAESGSTVPDPAPSDRTPASLPV